MRKVNLIFFAVIAAVMCTVALTACSSTDFSDMNDDEPLVDVEDAVAFLNFDLTVPYISDSRTPSGDYDDGRAWAYENHIAPLNCQFLLFEPEHGGVENTKLLCVCDPEEVLHREDDSKHTAKRYTVTGKVKQEYLTSGSFKIMVLANWPVRYVSEGEALPGEVLLTPGVSTIDDVAKSSIYTFSDSWSLSDNFIPMYGIKECKNLILPDNYMVWLDNIHMLRSMAKVEVSTTNKGQLDKAILVNYSSVGYAAPKNVYKQSDYVKDTYQGDYTDQAWVPDASVLPYSLEMNSYEDANHIKHFYAYVPEFLNVKKGSGASYINLYFIEQPIPVKLDFKYYTKEAAEMAGKTIGDEFDLLRNYYYKFTVNKSTGLEVSVSVAPYTVVSLNPNFGLADGENKRPAGDYKYE